MEHSRKPTKIATNSKLNLERQEIEVAYFL